MSTLTETAASSLKTISDSVERMATNAAALTKALRFIAPLIRRVAPSPDTDPRLAAFHAAALGIYRTGLLPALKETRREIDELIASIEGTWKPPTN